MRTFVQFIQDICLMLARITLGLLLVMHGWHRWDERIEKSVALLASHHIPQPEVFAWGATTLEVIGGVLLVLGVLTPLVAAFVVAQNALVIAWIKISHGWAVQQGGWEYNLALAALALVFVGHGSGRAGADALIFRRRTEDPERKQVRELP